VHPYLAEKVASEHRNDLLREAVLRRPAGEGRAVVARPAKWWPVRRRRGRSVPVLAVPVVEPPAVQYP